MLRKRLHALYRRTALVATMALVIVAATVPTLANENENSPSNASGENMSFNCSS